MSAEAAFFRLHGPGLPQQGPGGDATTRKALNRVRERLPTTPKVVDLGCGPGRQTLVLVRELRTPIVAVDTCQPYLDELAAAAAAAGLASLVRTSRRSMDDLDLPPSSLDLAWSEGAFYTVGVFEQLSYLLPLLRSGGVVCFSEIAWLTESPSRIARDFWREYPAMKTVEQNREMIDRLGYAEIDFFPLSRDDWESYYAPLRERLERVSENWDWDDPDAVAVLQRADEELYQYDHLAGIDYDYYFFLCAKR